MTMAATLVAAMVFVGASILTLATVPENLRGVVYTRPQRGGVELAQRVRQRADHLFRVEQAAADPAVPVRRFLQHGG
ncbi:hypothetical protein ACWEPC_50515 [Nonomuraea sp. NPDC004297]